MKNCVVPFSSIIALVCFAVIARAQPQIIVAIDTGYAHTGKIEFTLSQFVDEITDFYGVFADMNHVSNVTICGKVGTADPSIKNLGLVQLKSNRKFDSSFGEGVKVIVKLRISDYPNSMFITSDSASN